MKYSQDCYCYRLERECAILEELQSVRQDLQAPKVLVTFEEHIVKVIHNETYHCRFVETFIDNAQTFYQHWYTSKNFQRVKGNYVSFLSKIVELKQMYSSLNTVLETLHKSHIAYIDWSLSNILVAHGPQAVLIDFGLGVWEHDVDTDLEIVASFQNASPLLYQRLYLQTMREQYYPKPMTLLNKLKNSHMIRVNSTQAWKELKRADYYGLATIFADAYIKLVEFYVHDTRKTGSSVRGFCYLLDQARDEIYKYGTSIPKHNAESYASFVDALITFQDRRWISLTKIKERKIFPAQFAELEFVATLLNKIERQDSDPSVRRITPLSGSEEELDSYCMPANQDAPQLKCPPNSAV